MGKMSLLLRRARTESSCNLLPLRFGLYELIVFLETKLLLELFICIFSLQKVSDK